MIRINISNPLNKYDPGFYPMNSAETINLNYASMDEIREYVKVAKKLYEPEPDSIQFGPVPPQKIPVVSADETFKNILSRGYRQAESGIIIISPYLEKKMDLWVWDFDNTLIDIEAYKRHNMDPDIIRKHLTDAELDADIPNWGYFKKLVEYLVSTGKRVGIASFGTYSIIKAYMDRIFGMNQKYFGATNIIATCPDIGCDRSCIDAPLNKNSYILKLMKFYRIQGYESVVLFDDSSSNIADALRIGISAFQIDETTGLFGAQIMFMIEAKMQNACEEALCGASMFGSLGQRKSWKYDAQAYDDIFNRVLKPTRAAPITSTSTTAPLTDDLELLTTSTSASTTASTSAITPSKTIEGFKNKKEDTCVTCRAGHELWIISIILVLIIGVIIAMIV
jgi:hypothetical protein